MDNSLSVIRNVEVMSDNVRTWNLSVIQCFFPVIIFCLSFGGRTLCPCGIVLVGNGGKNDEMKGLNVLVMIRRITEGSKLQECN